MDNTNLKPCPCCGCEPAINSNDFVPYQVVCINPSCDLSGRISGDKQKAINAWNRRHIPEGMALVPVEPTNESLDILKQVRDGKLGNCIAFRAIIKAARGE